MSHPIMQNIHHVLWKPLAILTSLLLSSKVSAQVYNGPGFIGGMNYAQGIGGIFSSSIDVVILNIVFAVLSFMALAAVVVIVIAGIMLIVSAGDDGQKDKAKKMIFYTAIGLIIILLASAFVSFLLDTLNAGGLFGYVPNIGGNNGDLRGTITGILFAVLSFVGLLAVIMLVIAGIMLVVSGGDEAKKDRAQKLIIYAIIGLIVILLSSTIVLVIEDVFTSNTSLSRGI